MSIKIFLSPSNQSDNRYAWGDTNERDECGKVAHALEAALVRCGFETMLMHDENMATKVSAANKWGADYYLPIHSNAFNGQVSGTRMFYGSYDSPGYHLCKAIFDRLAPITPGTSENYKSYPGLYEVGYPNAYTAYTEIDFHDVPEAAKWIIEHTEDIAEAMCMGVCDHTCTPYVPPVQPPVDVHYAVTIGNFDSKEDAELLAALFADAKIVEV